MHEVKLRRSLLFASALQGANKLRSNGLFSVFSVGVSLCATNRVHPYFWRSKLGVSVRCSRLASENLRVVVGQKKRILHKGTLAVPDAKPFCYLTF